VKKILLIFLLFSAAVPSTMQASEDWPTFFQNKVAKVASLIGITQFNLNQTTESIQKEEESARQIELINNLLLTAVKTGNLGDAKQALAMGANVNIANTSGWEGSIKDNNDWTPLIRATRKGDLEMVVLLLDHDANVDYQDYRSCTALMHAADEGHLKIVKLLLENKANVDLINCYSKTTLRGAIDKEYSEIVELLLDHGVNLDNQEHGDETTELMEAAGEGHSKIVELLLKNKANVDLKGMCGWTALTYAARSNCPVTVRLLLDNGSGSDHILNQKDKFGKTAYDYGNEIVKKTIDEFKRERETN